MAWIGFCEGGDSRQNSDAHIGLPVADGAGVELRVGAAVAPYIDWPSDAPQHPGVGVVVGRGLRTGLVRVKWVRPLQQAASAAASAAASGGASPSVTTTTEHRAGAGGAYDLQYIQTPTDLPAALRNVTGNSAASSAMGSRAGSEAPAVHQPQPRGGSEEFTPSQQQQQQKSVAAAGTNSDDEKATDADNTINSLSSPDHVAKSAVHSAMLAAAAVVGNSPSVSLSLQSSSSSGAQAQQQPQHSAVAQQQRPRGDSTRSAGSYGGRSRGNSGINGSIPAALSQRSRGESIRSNNSGNSGGGQQSPGGGGGGYRQRARGDSTRSIGGTSALSERSNKDSLGSPVDGILAASGNGSDAFGASGRAASGSLLPGEGADDDEDNDETGLMLARADSVVSVDEPSPIFRAGRVCESDIGGMVFHETAHERLDSWVTGGVDWAGRIGERTKKGRLVAVNGSCSGFARVLWLDGSESEHKVGKDGAYELCWAERPTPPAPGEGVAESNCIAGAFVRRGPAWSRARYRDQDQPGGIGSIVRSDGDGWCSVEWLCSGYKNSYRISGGEPNSASELVFASAEDADLVRKLMAPRRGRKAAAAAAPASGAWSNRRDPGRPRRIIGSDLENDEEEEEEEMEDESLPDGDDDDGAVESGLEEDVDDEEEARRRQLRKKDSVLARITSIKPSTLASSLKKAPSAATQQQQRDPGSARHVQLSPPPGFVDQLQQQQPDLANASFTSTDAGRSSDGGKPAGDLSSHSNSVSNTAATAQQHAASLRAASVAASAHKQEEHQQKQQQQQQGQGSRRTKQRPRLGGWRKAARIEKPSSSWGDGDDDDDADADKANQPKANNKNVRSSKAAAEAALENDDDGSSSCVSYSTSTDDEDETAAIASTSNSHRAQRSLNWPPIRRRHPPGEDLAGGLVCTLPGSQFAKNHWITKGPDFLQRDSDVFHYGVTCGKEETDVGYVVVQWGDGLRQRMRAGAKGRFDLCYCTAEEAAPPVLSSPPLLMHHSRQPSAGPQQEEQKRKQQQQQGARAAEFVATNSGESDLGHDSFVMEQENLGAPVGVQNCRIGSHVTKGPDWRSGPQPTPSRRELYAIDHGKIGVIVATPFERRESVTDGDSGVVIAFAKPGHVKVQFADKFIGEYRAGDSDCFDLMFCQQQQQQQQKHQDVNETAPAATSSSSSAVEPLFSDLGSYNNSRKDPDPENFCEPQEYRPQWSQRGMRYYCGLRYCEDTECDCGRCDGRCGPSTGCACPICDSSVARFCGKSFIDVRANNKKKICGPLYGACPSCYERIFPQTVKKPPPKRNNSNNLLEATSTSDLLSASGGGAGASESTFGRAGSATAGSSSRNPSDEITSSPPPPQQQHQQRVPEFFKDLPSNFIFTSQDFALKKRIGRGGGGEVYEAQLVRPPHWRVAIKLFLNDAVGEGDEDLLRGAVQECMRCFSLNHTNIIKVLGVFVYEIQQQPVVPGIADLNAGSAAATRQALSMVMEKADDSLHTVLCNMPGSDHSHNVRKQHHHHHHSSKGAAATASNDDDGAESTKTPAGLPLPVVESYALQIFEGLNYLHSLKPSLVHRDVKPANILVLNKSSLDGHYSRLALCDFGLSAALERSRGCVTAAGRGTYRFCAPEQFLTNSVTPKADSFSAGAVLFWMVTNREPWREHAHLYCVPTKGVVPLCEQVTKFVRPDIASPNSPFHYLMQLTVACLALEPEDRPSAKRAVACIRSRSMVALSPEPSGEFRQHNSNDTDASVTGSGGMVLQASNSERFEPAGLDDTMYESVANFELAQKSSAKKDNLNSQGQQ